MNKPISNKDIEYKVRETCSRKGVVIPVQAPHYSLSLYQLNYIASSQLTRDLRKVEVWQDGDGNVCMDYEKENSDE